MEPWLLELGLYLLGLLLIFLELFIPSGGVLGIGSLICIIYSIYSMFQKDYTAVAWSAIVVTVLYVIVVVRFWVKRMTLAENLATSVATGSDVEGARSLVGLEGVTDTALRPAGIARVDGRRLDVVTSGSFLEPGETIVVVEVSGNRIVVRPKVRKT